MKKILALGMAAALLAVAPAWGGGGQKGDWELGVFGGYGFPDDYSALPMDLEPDEDFLFGGRVGYFFTPHISLEGTWQTFDTETGFSGPSQVDSDLDSIRLNFLWNFRAGEKFRPFATVGLGQESTDASGIIDEDDLGFNLGGGARWFFGQHFGVRVDGRLISTDVGGVVDNRQNDFETTVGALWTFGGGGPVDADGDGVIDWRDDCPDTPRGARVNEAGCPLDSDGDGVYDGLDACPDTAAGVPVDARGCPRDSDGDGVHDGDDACPDTPAGATVDARGCPMDSDGDGVPDGLDRCPDTPTGASVDDKGCPRDSDGDGVYDGLDRCPDTPADTEVDGRGCPVLFDDERDTLVLEGVRFEFNSAELTADSTAILDRVAVSLRQWSEIRVEVGGHTDSVGRDAYNQTLSQTRAESVRQYLVAKGIDAGQLEARGYGESVPVADNDTQEGRDQNRRVELKKLGE